MAKWHWLQKVGTVFGKVENVEGKYGVVERAPQAWKATKTVWVLISTSVVSAITTILNWVEVVVMPWLQPWAWNVISGSLFFLSMIVLMLTFYYRQNRFFMQMSSAGLLDNTPKSVEDASQEQENKTPEPTSPLARPIGNRESVRRLEEVVGNGNAIKLLWEFTEHQLLIAVVEKVPALSYFHSFVREQRIEPLRKAAQRWATLASNETANPEQAHEAFFEMYCAWQELRTLVDAYRQLLGLEELGCIPGFRDWHLASADFLNRLSESFARSDLRSLQKRIGDWHTGQPAVGFQLTPGQAIEDLL